jgi:hypothetical protein
MKSRELERYLKSNSPPDRDETYWQDFPEMVLRRIRTEDRPAAERPQRRPATAWFRLGARFAVVAGAAAVLAFFLAPRWRNPARPNEPLQGLRTCYQEVAELFPRQFEAVVFSHDGVELQLSEAPNVPDSPPLYVRICSPASKCITVVTFSGQTVHAAGREFEILADGKGEIFLLAKEGVWTAGNEQVAANGWRVESGWLGQKL